MSDITATEACGRSPVQEQVVLCSPDGAATGTALKAQVHHEATPLHLAFSCYVFDPEGRVLVTRRARTKATFPAVRTNSCCGHPAPGEPMTQAVRRRLHQELGVLAQEVDLILPAFRYRATAADGTVENELCPVYRVLTDDVRLRVDAAEVDDAWWVAWPRFTGCDDPGDPLSPWASAQVRQLTGLGPDPLAWPLGAAALLPAAARD